MTRVDLTGVGLPPWMDPDEHPTWCYVEIDEPRPLVDAVAILGPLVDPYVWPGTGWPAIRAYATAVGFRLTAPPVDELAARRRRRAAAGTRPRRRRRYAKGA